MTTSLQFAAASPGWPHLRDMWSCVVDELPTAPPAEKGARPVAGGSVRAANPGARGADVKKSSTRARNARAGATSSSHSSRAVPKQCRT